MRLKKYLTFRREKFFSLKICLYEKAKDEKANDTLHEHIGQGRRNFFVTDR